MANVTATVATGKEVVVGKGASAEKFAAGATVTLSAREKAVLVSQGIVS